MAYNPRCVTRCWGRPMRGGDARTEALFSYVSCEARVPMDHPLRAIRKIVNEALTALSPEAVVWDVTVFTKNRERLIAGDIAAQFMAAVLNQERVKALLSDDHFSVDGTLIEAWASMKSFRPKDGSGEPPAPGRNGERDFHGEKRSNETHASITDPNARLYRKEPALAKAGGQVSRPSSRIWGTF